MKAQDRDAIQVLMRKRDGKLPLDAGDGGATVVAGTSGSDGARGHGAEGGDADAGGGGGALPYGGDLQAAMKAQDRDAIRDIMRARDGKPKWRGVISGGGGGSGGNRCEGLALDDRQITEAAAAVKEATLGHGGRGKSGKRPSDLELPYGGDLRSVEPTGVSTATRLATRSLTVHTATPHAVTHHAHATVEITHRIRFSLIILTGHRQGRHEGQ